MDQQDKRAEWWKEHEAAQKAKAAWRYDVRIDRTCPRCRAHRYHRAVDCYVGRSRCTVICSECAHEWRGRLREDEQVTKEEYIRSHGPVTDPSI